MAVGILAAVQAGIVLAKPLPQYKDGKNVGNSDSYAGPALVGEAGRELWMHDGKVDLVDKATVVNVGRNDRILPNALTERLLNDEHAIAANAILGRNRAGQRAGDQLASVREAYQAGLLNRALSGSAPSADAIGRAVGRENAKLPFNHTTFDGQGVSNFVQQANTRRTVQAKKHQVGK